VIVPSRGRQQAALRFVPFDDDHILAVVLSKAFLLADGHKIVDKSILRQLT
jgi:hypothetical protein